MTDVHEIVGYVVCVGCGNELVLDVIAGRTGGLCPACFAAHGKPLRTIEVEARGTRIPVPLEKPRRRRAKKNPSPEAKARERQIDKCKDRARKRLQAIFPDLYDILLAQERAAAGFDPWPYGTALRSGPDPDGNLTTRFAALYHALDERGVDV